MEITTKTSYLITDDGIIIKTSINWDIFANLNDGNSATTNNVIGKSIYSFIYDKETINWLKKIILLVKTYHEPIIKIYRCDSPNLKRFMEMSVSNIDKNIIVVYHRVLRVENIEKVIYFETTDSLNSSVKRCSICNKLRINHKWYEIENIPNSFFDNLKELKLKVFYGVCSKCRGES